MRINTNISAITANNSLQRAEEKLSKSIQRLSSGYKINSSEDDPAGCAISEKMRMQLRGLERAKNNTTDGTSVLNTAEGAITEIQAMLARMKELTVQAANDVNSDEEREAIQEELNSINKEINRISDETEFNTQPLINGNLSRRVYSDQPGVKQLECSDGFTAKEGGYGITVTKDARQAVATGNGTISMTGTRQITEAEAGIISINGYKVAVNEGDTIDTIMGNVIEAANKIGGNAFVVSAAAANDTKTNGTEYAGYQPQASFTGNRLVIMTDDYGSDQSITITCDNVALAGLLGISDATTEEGIYAEGSNVEAKFTTDANGDRIGFENSAIISTSGTNITVRDINNKVFRMDVPGNVAGTKFNDVTRTDGKSTVTAAAEVDINQEVTDIGTMSIHVGANEYQNVKLDIPEMTAYSLGTDKINVMTGYTAARSIAIVDEAVTRANAIRSKIGAYQNRFDTTTSNLAVSTENLNSSISAMIDTDMAEEMTEYTSMNILSQAATSILAQANERPSTVLQILQ